MNQREHSYQCPSCERLLEPDDFGLNKQRLNGRHSYCKQCRREKYSSSKSERRAYSLQKLYGLSVEDYDSRLAQQNNSCATCYSETPGNSHQKYFHVDHDHESGEVRGLLCSNCNIALGQVRDSQEVLLNMITYLQAAECASC